MPKTILKSPNLSGGLSTQPKQVRFPNQVEEALNAAFLVFDGASKRPGTLHVAAPVDLPSSGDYRMHSIVRDESKQFLAIFGDEANPLRVIRASDGEELDVTISAAALPYLQAGSASDFRLITVTDHSFIVNTTIPTRGKKSATYSIDNTYADYDAMVAAAPANGTRNKTTADTVSQPRGFFIVEAATAGTVQPEWTGPSVSGSKKIDYWKGLLGSSLFPQDRAFRLTVNDGSIDRTFTYKHETAWGSSTLKKVAKALTKSQSPAPLPGEEITIAWDSNRFSIWIPTGWTFVGMGGDEGGLFGNSIVIGGKSYHNLNDTGAPFEYAAGVIGTTTVGAYGDQIYTRIPPSNQENAEVDETTMPVKLVRAPNDTFTVDVIDWGFRHTGNENTNPLPSILANGLPISDIAYHRDRLVFAGDERIVFSQSGNIYDLYLNDDRNIVESDPIDVQLSGSRVSKIRHLISFGKRLVIDTEAHQQFELTDADKLTYETVAITPTTQIESMAVKPIAIGLSLFIAGKTSDARQLMEYVYDDIRAGSDATDVGEHVKGLLPDDIRALVGSSNARVVMAVQGDGPRILTYNFYWNGNQKQQAAWSEWQLDANAVIQDAASIGTDAYLLVARGEQMVIERLPLSAFTAAGETPIHLDRQVEIIDGGVYTNDGYTTWELPTVDGGWDTAVLVGPEWGANENKVLTIKHDVAAANNKVFTFGRFDVAGGKVVFGQKYPFRIKVSRPYRRDQNGQPILGETLTAMRWIVEVRRSGDLTLKSVDDSTSKLSRQLHFTKETPTDARLQAWFGGNVDRMKLVIESDGPKPATVTGWELEAMTGRR